MLDYETHAQATPQLATILSTSGATMEKAKKSRTSKDDDDDDAAVDTSMARKASDKEEKFMSQLNTPDYDISPEQALLCPARVRGYSFEEKIWAFFLVDEVQEIKWHPNAFDSLELDDRMKSAILALVSAHQESENFDVGRNFSNMVNLMLNSTGHYTRKRKGSGVSTLWQTGTWENSDSGYAIISRREGSELTS